ncbi:chitin synthase chs-2-like isoform X2 [Tachypleus tridentatus]|uniref:chitin synthase chs-2-like isoform X2 n=1 Tax=Tachypleus tridentatus TaxID=6853 RepID=UPI003FD5DF69
MAHNVELDNLDSQNEIDSDLKVNWDIYEESYPVENSIATTPRWVDWTLKIIKLAMYLITFTVLLVSGVLSKITLMFMMSQLKKNHTIQMCNKKFGYQGYYAIIPDTERVVWIWCLFFVLAIPQLGTLLRHLRIYVFKVPQTSNLHQKTDQDVSLAIFLLFVVESLHVIGLVLLVFLVLPELDAVKAAMLTNCIFFLPGLVAFLSREKKLKSCVSNIFDILSLVAQSSGFVVWTLIFKNWAIPAAVVLVSINSLENYIDVNNKSPMYLLRKLIKVKKVLETNRYFIFIIISIWKIILTFCGMSIIVYLTANDVSLLFRDFLISFQEHSISIKVKSKHITEIDLGNTRVFLSGRLPLYLLFVQVVSSWICYTFGKFACKICIQRLSFAFPICLTVPVSISLLLASCETRKKSVCFFQDIFPDFLFWTCPEGKFIENFIKESYVWLWVPMILSQTWITAHIWNSKVKRMTSTQELFVNPLYVGALVDQTMALYRRRKTVEEDEKLKLPEEYNTFLKMGEAVKIFACATMWHETSDEMVQLLQSLMRLDKKQCTYRILMNEMAYKHRDHFEFEAHIFFDDAFEYDEENDITSMNTYVKSLINSLKTAANYSYYPDIVMALKKIETPYGGRLEWTMPGGNPLIVHLKDTRKIRHKKRWSQVCSIISSQFKEDEKLMEAMGDNTFILALDGDTSFQPPAVSILVDLMKRNNNLGAACGRIHPIGSGFMVWYQKFEYAIGHWLQKATEHVIGCVLCSPGCFSLFRAKALLQDNVLKTYTKKSEEPLHYVQYDQGEDRWLCTLLLQQGYKVEYSAASDAYTHCPETFKEFFTQRRRWAPSTLANIMQLLNNYKRTVALNGNISYLYIMYQSLLMIGTILGPGTIFLMLLGAMVAALGIDNWTSLWINLIPIIFFTIICFLANNNTQILVAQILSGVYSLLMMTVLIGTAIQMKEDGIGSPSAIFLIALTLSFVIAAIIHPQEIGCIIYGVLYFIYIPSMYLLLTVYYLINLNNVSWGTRDDQSNKAEQEKPMGKTQWLHVKRTETEEDGGITCGLGSLFKCMFCTYPKTNEQNLEVLKINEKLETLMRKMEPERVTALHRRSSASFKLNKNVNSLSSIIEEAISEPESINDDNVLNTDENPKTTWIEDTILKEGKLFKLSVKESLFFQEVIDTYLYPLSKDEKKETKVASGLITLRNKVAFVFLMSNALFILIVFLLQLNKERLHLKWPLGVKSNITYIPKTWEVRVSREYLELEPIGIVFASFFAIILVIQFVAMLIHRFETFSLLLSSVKLKCFEQDKSLLSHSDSFTGIATHLQRLDSLEECDKTEKKQVLAPRRKTIHYLHSKQEKKQKSKYSVEPIMLEDIFKKRYSKVDLLDSDDPIVKSLPQKYKRRATLSHLNFRRQSLFHTRRSRLNTHVFGMHNAAFQNISDEEDNVEGRSDEENSTEERSNGEESV